MALPWAIQQIKDLLAKFPVKVADGGTGLAANPSMLTNLDSTTAANVFQASPRPGVTGTLGVQNGGTGVKTNPSLLVNLASASAAGVFQAAPRPGVTGVLGPGSGGTGVGSLAQLAAKLGINTSGGGAAPKPVSGTGVGQWLNPVFGGSGGTYTFKLPAGGTWVYSLAYQYAARPEYMNGMAAGGTQLIQIYVPDETVALHGWAWRIA